MEQVSGFFSLETLAIIAVFVFLVSYTVLYRQNRALINENEQFAQHNEAVHRLNHIFAQHDSFEGALQSIVDDIRMYIKADIAGLYLSRQTTKTVHLAAVSGMSEQLIEGLRFLKQDEAFIASVFASAEPLIIEDLFAKPRLTNATMKRDDWMALIAAPVIYRDEMLGVVFGVKRKKPLLKHEHLDYLTMIGDFLGSPIKAAILQVSLNKHRVKDPHTNLYTRAAFDRHLKTEIMRSERFARVISVVLMKIEDYDELMQICGAEAIEMTMRDISSLVTKNTRVFDIACKYEDSMFAMLLPETDAEGAHIVAERLQRAIGKTMFDNGNGERVVKLVTKLSVATYPFVLSRVDMREAASSSETLIEAARQALGYTGQTEGSSTTTALA